MSPKPPKPTSTSKNEKIATLISAEPIEGRYDHSPPPAPPPPLGDWTLQSLPERGPPALALALFGAICVVAIVAVFYFWLR